MCDGSLPQAIHVSDFLLSLFLLLLPTLNSAASFLLGFKGFSLYHRMVMLSASWHLACEKDGVMCGEFRCGEVAADGEKQCGVTCVTEAYHKPYM
jgi:hypothetical protein